MGAITKERLQSNAVGETSRCGVASERLASMTDLQLVV
jgi:hypothetical protein